MHGHLPAASTALRGEGNCADSRHNIPRLAASAANSSPAISASMKVEMHARRIAAMFSSAICAHIKVAMCAHIDGDFFSAVYPTFRTVGSTAECDDLG